jgi:hypothetical protein
MPAPATVLVNGFLAGSIGGGNFGSFSCEMDTCLTAKTISAR